MKRFIILFSLGAIVSFYFFPFAFTFLPHSLNTKMILGAIGGTMIAYRCFRTQRFVCPNDVFGAAVIAVLFSAWCFIVVTYYGTKDDSYYKYFLSFLTWMTGAYTVCASLRAVHGKVTFKLLTYYLAGVCVAQCILAMMIDRIPAFKSLVDSVVFQGQEFFTEIGRLYGIGAALDPSGIRFGIVLLMIAFLIFKDAEIRLNKRKIFSLLLAFFIIAVIGNMIARTTSVGMIMGMAYMIYSMHIFRVTIKIGVLNIGTTLLVVAAAVIFIVVYLYRYDAQVYNLLRFAFEGFFNWVERGEWTTNSTTKLNTEMWIWPTDLKTWIMGTGWFGFYHFSTDIGYCRFILHCGLVGFSMFASFFIYNGYVFAKKNYDYRLFFFALILLGFIIWLKVSTDIFLIYALFYSMDAIQSPKESDGITAGLAQTKKPPYQNA